jgi:IclR family transcriptional regulator, acetate operon repressor
LITIGIRESSRATRVHMSPSEGLPLHATGSGLVFLAFGPKERLEETIAAGLKAYTPNTVTDPVRLRKHVAEIREAGYAVADQTYEEEVIGIGVPLFDGSGTAVGGLAVATPDSRMTPDLKALIVDQLHRAALAATAGIGGVPHPAFLAAVEGRKAA